MRRAILTVGGTAAGLAALLSFKTHPAADVTAAGPSASVSSPGTAAPRTAHAARRSARPSPRPHAGQTAAGQPTASATAPGPSASSQPAADKTAAGKTDATRTVTGTVATTPYGPMQVQLVLAGQRISQVNVLQHTDSGPESAQVDSFALPRLTSETLTAQSARIDAVSGATYTSAGYIKSLQSAVDAAGLQ